MQNEDKSIETRRARPILWSARGLGSAILLVLALSVPVAAPAQQLGVDTSTVTEQPGSENGNYHTDASLELGVQIVGVGGSSSMYDTLVNLQTGPRILEQSLNMRSLNHEGLIFDRLSMYSFGYGGNPNQVTRLNMSKNKWYDFGFIYRYDQNVWDYNLLANPLNPVNNVVNVDNSPHTFLTRRNMQTYDATLFPESRFRVRLGFDWISNQGPSYSSVHEGTDAQLTQNFRVSSSTYRFGVDYKLFKNTSFSYDQSFVSFKNNTWDIDQSQYFVLSNGTPVDIGLPYNPGANQPCSTPFVNGAYNATCVGFLSYQRTGPLRSFFPTGKISFQSHDIEKLSLTASYAYSGGYAEVNNFSELFDGLISRTGERTTSDSGPSKVKRVVTDAEFGATYQFTEKLSFSDTFRWWNSRAPGYWNSTSNSCFPNASTSLLSGIGVFNSPGVSPQICLGGSGLPMHVSNSPADLTLTQFYRYQFLDYAFNTATLNYNVNPHLGGYLGFRYGNRQDHTNDNMGVTDATVEYFYPNNANRGAPCTQTLPDGTCIVVTPFTDSQDAYQVQNYSGLFGVWVRPINNLRINGDVEIMSASGANGVLFTRIEPRNLQLYKVRGRYTPHPWLLISGTLNWQENRNSGPDTDGSIKAENRAHNRYFGFDVSLTKNIFAFDVGYNYNNVYSATNVCINLGTKSTPADPCFADSGGSNTFGNWRYQNTVNTVYFNAIVRPRPWLAFQGGLNLVDSSGQDPIYLPITNTFTVANVLQPAGSLDSLYWRPTGSVAVGFKRNWEAKGAYGYYDYNERGFAGPVAPRDFHANVGTVSVKYVF
jgi:hypothetical protein